MNTYMKIRLNFEFFTSFVWQILSDLSLNELGLSTVEILASVVSRPGSSGGGGGAVKPVDYLSAIPILVKQVFVTRSQPASEVT